MTRITVVPAKNRSVPDPESGELLPDEGRDVLDSPYWRRRIADGDVTLQSADQAPGKEAKTK